MSTENPPLEDNSNPVEQATIELAPPGGHRGSVFARFKKASRALSRLLDWRTGALVLLIAVSIPVWRALNTHARTRPLSVPSMPLQPVAVARIAREDLYNEVTIPAEFRPYLQVEL